MLKINKRKYYFAVFFVLALSSSPLISVANQCQNTLLTHSLKNTLKPLYVADETPEAAKQRAEFVTEFNNRPEANTFLVGTGKFASTNIQAEVDSKHRTVRFFHNAGRVPLGSKARILLLHGNGSSVSRALTMNVILRMFTEPLPSTSKTVKKIRRNQNFIPIAAEAIDQPGHGYGPDFENFKSSAQTANWLSSYLLDMKNETPDLPIFIFTRSSSAAMATEAMRLHPELATGLILMSPTLPGDAEILARGTQVVLAEAAKGIFQINPEGLAWIGSQLKQIHWSENTFVKPTFILTGSADAQVATEERSRYLTFGQQPNVVYRDYVGKEHNVLDTSANESTALDAYNDIYKFINSVLKGLQIKPN